jgi:DNA/RNA endonuclease YhcR with UshA esterase domain
MQPPQATAPLKKSAAGNTTAKPSPQDIADAKSKGLVWVNSSTHVYHKDGSYYGNTKHGKFMSEDDAKKAGNHAAKESDVKKK